MEYEIQTEESLFLPISWAWGGRHDDGVEVQEVPEPWQDWYGGAYWSEATGVFACDQEEWDEWWQCQRATAETAKEILAAFLMYRKAIESPLRIASRAASLSRRRRA